jgi:hypothetical protein
MNSLQKKYGSEPKWFRKLFAKQPGVKALQGRRLSLPLARMDYTKTKIGWTIGAII